MTHQVANEIVALALTLRIAACAIVLILPFGILAAYGLSRYRGPGKSLIETLLALPLVLPPVAIGLILLELLSRSTSSILFTWKSAVIATAAMSFPLLVRGARSAFDAIDPRLADVARTLGRGPLYVFWRVTLPLAWRGVVGGLLTAFARALGEFGATIVVAGSIPGETRTLSLAIFQHIEAGRDAAAMRLVGLSLACAFLCLWSTERLLLRSKRGR